MIKSGDKGEWKSESDQYTGGTAGSVSYNILDPSQNSVSVRWVDPFQGRNDADGDVSDDSRYRLDKPGPISGNNIEMDFTLQYLG